MKNRKYVLNVLLRQKTSLKISISHENEFSGLKKLISELITKEWGIK